MKMKLDCDNYTILVRTNGHPCERRTIARDAAVGVDSAKAVQRALARKYPQCTVECFAAPGGGRMLLVA